MRNRRDSVSLTLASSSKRRSCLSPPMSWSASQFVGPEHAADRIADPVFLAASEAAADVKDDLGGLADERRLQLCLAASRVDQKHQRHQSSAVTGIRLTPLP